MPFAIPETELTFRAVRAGGPGGQHVNKVSTKIELLWDVGSTESLTEDERALLMSKLANRIDSDGILRVVAGDRRSQLLNRNAALKRMAGLVNEALLVPKKRKKTRPPARAAEDRLAAKKRRADLKTQRRKVDDD